MIPFLVLGSVGQVHSNSTLPHKKIIEFE